MSGRRGQKGAMLKLHGLKRVVKVSYIFKKKNVDWWSIIKIIR